MIAINTWIQWLAGAGWLEWEIGRCLAGGEELEFAVLVAFFLTLN